MGRYFVTGRGGSGKSTICRELKKRGFPAFDTDEVPGMCQWQDRLTGKRITVDPSGDIDFTKIAWAWQDSKIRQILDEHEDLVLCGSASNQAAYQSQFDKIFILMLNPKTHDHRLRTRDFDYGKHPDLRRRLVLHHQQFAENLIAKGAIPINTLQSVKASADEVLSHCDFTNVMNIDT